MTESLLQGLNKPQRIALTQRIMAALDEWGLSGRDILKILDFPDSERSRKLQQYRKETPFPDIEQVNRRVIRILGIIDALRTTYPRNARMGTKWMNAAHRRMKKRTPLATMLADGEGGVIAVLSELDCAYAWELSGSVRT